jgi:GH25 family lysozyme M1 (1,4-beta-N-acetylmuramidase)
MPTIKRKVVDIYRGDRVTSFKKAVDDGVVGVIHKATTGISGKDSEYAVRRTPAGKAGLLWGAYHWGTGGDVDKQIRNFLNVAEPDANTLVALDFEPTEGNTMSLAQARAFLEGVASELGRKPVLYSGHLIKDRLGSKKDAFFGSHRLWLAQYGPTPKTQASWKNYWIWQFTDGDVRPGPRGVAGIPGDSKGRLDLNHYDGTDAQLRKEWAS